MAGNGPAAYRNRCHAECGLSDGRVPRGKKRFTRTSDHRCVLPADHLGQHDFIARCALSEPHLSSIQSQRSSEVLLGVSS